MVERPKGFLYTHTPRGRYEEYQQKHAHILAQTQGEARYQFEKTLDMDAKRYARNAVTRDVLFVMAVTGGAVFVAREVKRGTLIETLTSIPQRVGEIANNLKSTLQVNADAALQHAGEQIGVGIMASAEAKAPEIGGQVAYHASEAIETYLRVSMLRVYADISDRVTGLTRTVFGGILGLGKKS